MPRDPKDIDRPADPPRGDAASEPAPTTGPERSVGGRYRLEEVLGRGGMGVVWAAHDELLNRPVAVKEVTPPAAIDDDARADLRARTMREAQTAARVSAEGVVAIYDVVEDDGRPWIVMERLPPRTLQDEIAERGGLPLDEVAQISATLLDGLMAAHAAGVLHRDVKPSNVMFRQRPDGRSAVLVDFGIAHVDGDAALTSPGVMVGSPAYVAPERARGEPATPASDLWSLGLTLWAAVHGWSPFQRESSLASLNAVLTEELPHPADPSPLDPVLERLLTKDPAERLDAATARTLLSATVLDAEAGSSATPPSDPSATRPLVTPGPTTTDEPPTAEQPPATVPPSTDPPPTTRPPTVPPSSRTQPSPAPPSPHPAPPPQRRAPRRRKTLLPVLTAVGLVVVVLLGAAMLQGLDGGAEDPTGAGREPTPAPAEKPAPGDGEPDGGGDTSADPDEGPAPPEEDAAQPDEGSESAPGEDAAPDGAEQPADGEQSADGEVPPGFERYTDETGFSVVIPSGWQAEREGPRVYLEDPASRAYLLVDQTDDPAADPVADWEQQEPAVADRLENYERLGEIRAVDYRGWDAADWEFVFGPGQSTHVLNRNVVTGPDQAYALYWSVPSSQWEAMLPVHEQVAASFQPAG